MDCVYGIIDRRVNHRECARSRRSTDSTAYRGLSLQGNLIPVDDDIGLSRARQVDANNKRSQRETDPQIFTRGKHDLTSFESYVGRRHRYNRKACMRFWKLSYSFFQVSLLM